MHKIESITKQKKKKLKKMEETELSVMDQLQNTTMIHNYMQSRFEEAFWPGLSISTNLGSNSHRSNHQESSTQNLNQNSEVELENKLNMMFTSSSKAFGEHNKNNTKLMPVKQHNRGISKRENRYVLV